MTAVIYWDKKVFMNLLRKSHRSPFQQRYFPLFYGDA